MAISNIVGRQQKPSTIDSLFAPHTHMTDNWPTFPLGMANVIVIDMAHCHGDCRLPLADCWLSIGNFDCILTFCTWLPPCQLSSQIGYQWAAELPSHQWQQIVTGSDSKCFFAACIWVCSCCLYSPAFVHFDGLPRQIEICIAIRAQTIRLARGSRPFLNQSKAHCWARSNRMWVQVRFSTDLKRVEFSYRLLGEVSRNELIFKRMQIKGK